MTQYTIAVLVGSLRRDSFNRKLAHAIAKLAPPDFTLEVVQIDDLPLYNQDDDDQQAMSVLRAKAAIKKAHGLLFITPEYNRSMPGVLKNAIDHASRPYGQSVWAGKPAGVLGVSVGAIGTALAQQHRANEQRICANMGQSICGVGQKTRWVIFLNPCVIARTKPTGEPILTGHCTKLPPAITSKLPSTTTKRLNATIKTRSVTPRAVPRALWNSCNTAQKSTQAACDCSAK
jgi:chromate reductase, NAD(P)H dehydrogenase (quinone)